MSGYIFDTNVLSILLNAAHARHRDVRDATSALGPESAQYISIVSIGELTFGVQLRKMIDGVGSPELEGILTRAGKYAVLEVTEHTARAYGHLKANLAGKYLTKALKRDRPRWVEDWVDKVSGKALQIDENDLWICAQAKERALEVVTTDRKMQRIAKADEGVELLVV